MRVARLLAIVTTAVLLSSGCSILSGRNLANINCEFPDDRLTLAPNWVCDPVQVGTAYAALGNVSVANKDSLQAQQAARNIALAKLASQLQANVSQQTGIYVDELEAAQLALASLDDVPLLGSRRSPSDELYVVIGLDHANWLQAGQSLLEDNWLFWQVNLSDRGEILRTWLEFSDNSSN